MKAAPRVRRAAFAVLILLSAACAPMSGTGAAAGGATRIDEDRSGPIGPYLREDKIVIGDFSFVTAVAVTRRFVFATTRGGLIVLDRQSRRWLPPFTTSDGYPLEGASVVAGDPTDDAVLIGTAGAVLTYRPSLGAVTRTIVPGQIERILFDRSRPIDGAFVLASGRWYGIGMGGVAMPVTADRIPAPQNRIGSESVEEVYRRFPNVRGFESILTRDDLTLRSARVTSAARAPERSEVWLGTAGRGLIEVDPIFAKATPHPFGLLGADATALARSADGVVVATRGQGGSGGGLSVLSDDLATARWFTGDRNRVLDRMDATRIAVRDGSTWMLASDGVLRASMSDPESVRRVAEGELPRSFGAIVTRRDGAWIGGREGLRFVDDSANSAGSVLFNGTVTDIWADSRMLYLGTLAGLFIGSESAGTFESGAQRFSDLRLGQSAVAVAGHDSTLAVLLAGGELLELNLMTHRVFQNRAPPLPSAVPGLARIAIDGTTIAASTLDRVLVLSRVSRIARTLRAGSDLPGQINDVLLTPGALWIATTRGVVRWRRLTDGSLP
jgi:ligand-binding sensor domain-containing protein